MDSAVQANKGRPITVTNQPVLILNRNGEFMARFASVKDTARNFRVTERTITRYIENGNLWKSKKVFLDFALEVR